MDSPASKLVRVRFAPSPTGHLHIGGARTALFNYLFARHHQGKFLLRIEDTDLCRSDQAMTDVIFRSLVWLGLDWDEEPVFQSIRLSRHRTICEELVRLGKAYFCFCTPEELAQKRESAQKEYKYDRTCLQWSPDEIQSKRNAGISYAVRFRVPEGETVFFDHVRKEVVTQNQEIDDFILLRSDGQPVYQVAVVVDDHDMGITHIIRGDDHLSNTSKQILLYHALGWDVPEFAHVPMILGPDKKRLSKRHGATSVEEYQHAGFLAQALVNTLALIGWSPGNDREIMTLQELIETFSLEGISRNAGVFDEKKLEWVNAQYLGRMTDAELSDRVIKQLVLDGVADTAFAAGHSDFILKFIGLMKPRVKKLTEFSILGKYFFQDPEAYDQTAVKKHWDKFGTADKLEEIGRVFIPVQSWKQDVLETTIRELADQRKAGAGDLIHPLRVALTGSSASPGIFEVMELLGKETVLRRIQKALHFIVNVLNIILMNRPG